MKPFRLTPAASAHLDIVRGISALAVMAGHLRALFLVDYSDIRGTRGLFEKALYFLTGFGHESVMVFFVLSGLFIGPAAWEAITSGRWSWKRYAVNRLTRLYIVLIPALLLTMALDRGGQRLPGAELGYHRPLPNYGGWTVAERTGIPILLGNAVFLESIECPPYGSDAPLWSLSYEFWYYVLFPVLVLALVSSETTLRRVMWAALAILVAWFIGLSLTMYFSIWLLGVLVAMLHARRPGPLRWSGLRIAVSGAILAGVLALVRAGRMPADASDYVVAVAAAVFVSALLRASGSWLVQSPESPYARVAHWFAGFSYTLYLIHLPILVFLHAALISESRWQPTLDRLAGVAAIGLGVLGCCYAVSLATEAQTARVRNMLLR